MSFTSLQGGVMFCALREQNLPSTESGALYSKLPEAEKVRFQSSRAEPSFSRGH